MSAHAQVTIQERIDSLLRDSLFQRSHVSIMVYDLTADTLMYAHSERQLMRPASTMKLMTAITALDRLGGDYRFTTSMHLDGNIVKTARHHNNLYGDIIVTGGMDPMFGPDDMNAFIETLQKEQIDTIYGSIKADMSFKDSLLLGAGWCWDDKNPVLSPLLWNHSGEFIPKLQQRIEEAGIIMVGRKAMTPDEDSSASEYANASSQPSQPSGETCEHKIKVERHHTISQILNRMMKHSDNLFAETLFYQIAANEHKPATAKTAIYVMNQFIKRLGLNPADYLIADGSGLSLYNYQTSELQIRLLRYAFRNSNIFSQLYPTLPVAGVDGTLKSRMNGSKAAGNVHAKTGTVTGVSSLAGYLTAPNGNTIAFSIINQGIRSAAPAKHFQNKVCNILCSFNK